MKSGTEYLKSQCINACFIYKKQHWRILLCQYSTDQHSSIEEAAYELYVQKGRLDGDDLSDWFHAEKIIHEKMADTSGDGVPKHRTTARKSKKTV